jgi:hypothetical protein
MPESGRAGGGTVAGSARGPMCGLAGDVCFTVPDSALTPHARASFTSCARACRCCTGNDASGRRGVCPILRGDNASGGAVPPSGQNNPADLKVRDGASPAVGVADVESEDRLRNVSKGPFVSGLRRRRG